MLQPHLFSFNDMGGEGGHGPHVFFLSEPLDPLKTLLLIYFYIFMFQDVLN